MVDSSIVCTKHGNITDNDECRHEYLNASSRQCHKQPSVDRRTEHISVNQLPSRLFQRIFLYQQRISETRNLTPHSTQIRTHNSTYPRTSLAESSGENPVPVRCVLAFLCLHGLAPSYLSETLHLSTEVDARRRLSSASTSTLVVYHPPVDPLSATVRSLWPLHVPGILCHPVFGPRRRWYLSVYI